MKLIFSILFLVKIQLAISFGDFSSNDDEQDFEVEETNLTTRQIQHIENRVKFILYTRDCLSGQDVTATNLSLNNSKFDPTRRTKFMTHGFQSSGSSDTSQSIKDAYLTHQDVNVFVVDWSTIAKNLFYLIPAASTRQVGEFIATFINFLIDSGVNPDDVHLVGHSLGAHISGFAGENAKGKLARISGLDPAFPSFGKIQMANGRLSKGQAKFVDVIHTSAGVYGLAESIGHVDFFPNGGIPPQPGCGSISAIVEACSHSRSWQFFKESINPANKFISCKCTAYKYFVKNECKSTIPVVQMGEYVALNATGDYYLETNSQSPFARNSTDSCS